MGIKHMGMLLIYRLQKLDKNFRNLSVLSLSTHPNILHVTEINAFSYQINFDQILNNDHLKLFCHLQTVIVLLWHICKGSSSSGRFIERTLTRTLEYRFLITLRWQNLTGSEFPKRMGKLDSSRIRIKTVGLNKLMKVIMIFSSFKILLVYSFIFPDLRKPFFS